MPESIFTIIQRSIGLALKSISVMKVTIQDIRANYLGGLLTCPSIEIWKMAIFPFSTIILKM